MNNTRGKGVPHRTKLIKSKRGEFGFIWLFAIFAGIAILVLSIYGAMKVVKSSDLISTSEIAKELTILTDPVEAGFAQTVTAHLEFAIPTRIRNLCGDIDFGDNSLSAATYNRKKWSEYGISTKTSDKYIFSQEIVEGKKLYIISEKFSYPYKVSDILILLSDKKTYCFNDPPQEIKFTIDGWDIEILMTENCSQDDKSIQVCFESSNCDIGIYGGCTDCDSEYEYGRILDKEGTKKYVNGLMFAAIFSESNNYECNVKRLMYKTSMIAQIFIDRIPLMSSRGCSSNLAADLSSFQHLTKSATSNDLFSLKILANELNRRKILEPCGSW